MPSGIQRITNIQFFRLAELIQNNREEVQKLTTIDEVTQWVNEKQEEVVFPKTAVKTAVAEIGVELTKRRKCSDEMLARKAKYRASIKQLNERVSTLEAEVATLLKELGVERRAIPMSQVQSTRSIPLVSG